MLFRKTAALLSVVSAVAESQTGSTYQVIPDPSDEAADHDLAFRVFFQVKSSGGAADSTVDTKIQTSVDGVEWADVTSATQVGQDESIQEWSPALDLGPYVRAVTELGGTLPDHTCSVTLAGSGGFSLHKVA